MIVNTVPTRNKSRFAAMRFARMAPSGAARSPPMINPIAATVKASRPIVIINVSEITVFRKNRYVFPVQLLFT